MMNQGQILLIQTGGEGGGGRERNIWLRAQPHATSVTHMHHLIDPLSKAKKFSKIKGHTYISPCTIVKTLLSLAVYPLIFPEPRQSKKKGTG